MTDDLRNRFRLLIRRNSDGDSYGFVSSWKVYRAAGV
jgi:hypothetical protein